MVALVLFSLNGFANKQGIYITKNSSTGEVTKIPVTVDMDNIIVYKTQNLPNYIERKPSSIIDEEKTYFVKSWTQRAFDNSLQKYH
jgi:hypothetical protein